MELSLVPTIGPSSPGRLIGRSEEVSGLVQALVEGEHRILTGPDKVGKTSVARAAVAALVEQGWFSVSVDLLHTSDTAALIDRLGEAVRWHAEDLRPAAPKSVGEALKLLQTFAEENDRRVVLFIDELQEIATTHLFGNPDDLTQQLRAALDEASQVVCLLVGSVPSVTGKLFTSEDEAFYLFGRVVSLPAIPTSTWAADLRALFMEARCDIDDPAMDRLLELSEGHAHSTMLIARWTYVTARRHETTVIDRPLVEEAFGAALAGEGAVNESKLVQVRTLSKHALGIMLRVAKGQSAYKHLPPAIARQTLRLLETAGVVDHPHSGAWRIADPLFRQHLLRTIDVDAAGATLAPEAPYAGVIADTVATVGASEDAAVSTPAAAVEHEPADEIRLDPADLSFRHPTPEEATAVGQVAAHAVASQGNDQGDSMEHTDEEVSTSHQSTGRRFGRFVERTVTAHPEWYRQLEADGRPVGGLVLYRPQALIGPGTSTGIDPLVQFGLLAVVIALAFAGCAVLIVERAWMWGGLGGLLFAALIGCLVQALLLVKGVFGRARASWIARRHGGAVVEGLWSQPEATQAIFETLAKELPGTLVTGHVDTPDLLPTYRAAGFGRSHFRVVTGVLDPGNDRPVRAETVGVTGQLVSANGGQAVLTRVAERGEPDGQKQDEHTSSKQKDQHPSGGKSRQGSNAQRGSRRRRRRRRPHRSDPQRPLGK